MAVTRGSTIQRTISCCLISQSSESTPHQQSIHHPPARPFHRIAAARQTSACAHRPNILLSSVFGPYAQDDEYGSRLRNPMELYHNQVTRVQGPFSLRLFHRSWGLMLIQANLDAPCTLLDYPTLDRFVEEIRSRRYDIVGISGIVPNFLKVKKMCELVREHLPEAKIIVGGHVANIPDLARADRRRPRRAGRGGPLVPHASWAKTPSSPSATRRSSPDTARGRWASPRRRTAATWPPRSSLRSAAPWAATSAPPRRCSAARGTRSASTRRATSCSTSCASSKRT